MGIVILLSIIPILAFICLIISMKDNELEINDIDLITMDEMNGYERYMSNYEYMRYYLDHMNIDYLIIENNDQLMIKISSIIKVKSSKSMKSIVFIFNKDESFKKILIL